MITALGFLKGEVIYNEQGCWILRRTDSDGYRKLRYNGEQRRYHSVVYERIYGKRVRRVDRLEVDHLCRNKACCNPLHLTITTRKGNANNVDWYVPGKIRCPQGHPYDEENTYFHSKNGGKMCRECLRERGRAKYYRNKACKS